MSSTTSIHRVSAGGLRLAWRHYLDQAWRDRAVSIPGLLLPGVGNVLIYFVPPLAIASMLSRYGDGSTPDLEALLPAIAVLAGAWFAGEAVWRVGIHFLIRTEVSGISRLYKQAMDHLLRKDLAFFHDNFAGSLTKKAVAYARNYEVLMDVASFQVFGNVVPIFFAAFVLWGYSPLLILTLVGFLTLTVLVILPLIKRRLRLVADRETASNSVAGHVADSITNIDAVRAFAREDHEAGIHARNVDSYMAKVKRSYDYQNRRIDMATSPLYVMTNVVGLIVAILVGQGGLLSLEAVFVTFTYYVHLTRVFWEFNHIYRQTESHMSEAAQFTEMLLEPPRVVNRDAIEPFTPADSSVTFSGIRFRYSDAGGEHLFDGFDLAIASGERIGLVGRSGGGKSTVTKLLLRFMDVDAGEVLIGGRHIAKVDQAALREVIAYVPQDPVMFHRSLADNIRFGRLDATDAEVRAAAEMAHAAAFIDALPNGFETLVGERGVKLSGGQRQRIAIARAMLKAAPILVLDEATSSLDSESERLIQDALWRLMDGRTTIVIAHRLSTVQRLDRLIVLEQGRVVEQGSHRELLEAGGVYAMLWAHQSGGFLPADETEDAPARV